MKISDDEEGRRAVMQTYEHTFRGDGDFIHFMQSLVSSLPDCEWTFQGCNVLNFPYDPAFGPDTFDLPAFSAWLQQCERMQECEIAICTQQEQRIASIVQYDYYYMTIEYEDAFAAVLQSFELQ